MANLLSPNTKENEGYKKILTNRTWPIRLQDHDIHDVKILPIQNKNSKEEDDPYSKSKVFQRIVTNNPLKYDGTMDPVIRENWISIFDKNLCDCLAYQKAGIANKWLSNWSSWPMVGHPEASTSRRRV